MNRSRGTGRAGRRHGCLTALGIGALLLGGLWLAAPALLTAYARWLVVEDPVEPSDAIVVLGGGEGERLHASIDLYRKGVGRELVILGADTPLLPVYTGEDSLTQAEIKRRIAVRRGVPPGSVMVILGATSTYEEAQRALDAARSRGWRSLVVVTDPFHTRRARASFRHVFEGDPVRIAIYHLPEGRSEESPVRWWRREGDTMAVFTESLKLAYYGYRYRIRP